MVAEATEVTEEAAAAVPLVTCRPRRAPRRVGECPQGWLGRWEASHHRRCVVGGEGGWSGWAALPRPSVVGLPLCASAMYAPTVWCLEVYGT